MTEPIRLAAIEHVGIAREWLLGSADLGELMDHWPARTPAATSVRVEEVVQPPYPMLRVVGSPGGTMHANRWSGEAEVLVEAWGDTDGYPGPEALRAICLGAIEVLKALEDRDYAPWEAVVTGVDAAWPYPVDDPSGQPRWASPVSMHVHPPVAPESAPEAVAPRAARRPLPAATRRRDFMPRT